MKMSVRAIAAVAAVSSVAAAGAAVAAGPPGASWRSTHQRMADLSNPTRANVGTKGAAAPVSRGTTAARRDLRGSLGRQAVLTTDERTGGIKAVGRLDGFLTRASSSGAKSVALGYIRAHAGAFGLSAADLNGLKLVRDYTSPDGVTHLQWAQVVDGI